MSNTLDLQGRVAMITGGAGGMGRAMATRLLQRGAHCLLVDINAAALKAAASELGAGVSTWQADLTQLAAIETLVSHVAERYGQLDILINNAAIAVTGPFEERPVQRIMDELQINLVSPLAVTRLMLPLLQRASDPRVVSIASLGGIFPLPETAIYSASKFGLRGAMLCLGLDGPRLGVRFSVINPSATETPMLIREAIEDGNALQFMDPPQMPADVAEQLMRTLDAPKLERYVRPSESWQIRLAMLVPNLLPRLIPLFANAGIKGRARYLESLSKRGLIERRDGAWHLTDAPRAPTMGMPAEKATASEHLMDHGAALRTSRSAIGSEQRH